MKTTILAATILTAVLAGCSSIPQGPAGAPTASSAVTEKASPRKASADRAEVNQHNCGTKALVNGIDPASVRLHNACVARYGVSADNESTTIITYRRSPRKPRNTGSGLTVGKVVGAVLLGAVSGAVQSYGHRGYRRTHSTRYTYDRYGLLKSADSSIARSRIHRNRDGSIRRIDTKLKY